MMFQGLLCYSSPDSFWSTFYDSRSMYVRLGCIWEQPHVLYQSTFVDEDLCKPFVSDKLVCIKDIICYYSVLMTCWRSLVRRLRRTTPPSGSRTRRPTPACTARRFSSPSSTGDITAGQNQFSNLSAWLMPYQIWFGFRWPFLPSFFSFPAASDMILQCHRRLPVSILSVKIAALWSLKRFTRIIFEISKSF